MLEEDSFKHYIENLIHKKWFSSLILLKGGPLWLVNA